MQEINELNILREQQRYVEKEAKAKEKLKRRDNQSLSPTGRETLNGGTGFMQKLSVQAKKRQDVTLSIPVENRDLHLSGEKQRAMSLSIKKPNYKADIENLRQNRMKL